jgi:hypothetical protein
VEERYQTIIVGVSFSILHLHLHLHLLLARSGGEIKQDLEADNTERQFILRLY